MYDYQHQVCPICGAREFGDYRGRKAEKCAGCGAKERTRLHFLLLQRLGLKATGKPVLHFAPETPIAKFLINTFWDMYQPVDIDPSQYVSPTPIRQFDLTKDIYELPDNSLQGVFHSHILEHIKAPVGEIIKQLNRVLVPGGVHFFCVPIGADNFEEDYSDALTDEERLKRFGQEDHVRVFGRRDFEEMFIAPNFEGFTRIALHDLISQFDARRHAIRVGSVSPKSIPQTFVFVKD